MIQVEPLLTLQLEEPSPGVSRTGCPITFAYSAAVTSPQAVGCAADDVPASAAPTPSAATTTNRTRFMETTPFVSLTVRADELVQMPTQPLFSKADRVA